MNIQVLARLTRWLREYEQVDGLVSSQAPLLALLPRRLSSAELQLLAQQLSSHSPPDKFDIATAISGVTAALPSDSDVARVIEALDDGGMSER